MHRLVLLLLVLIVSLSAGCQVKQAELNSQGSDIGIAVHGNWTVEILNADGTVAETMQFQNDLHKEGEAFLAKVLMGSMGGLTVGQPLIEFDISTDGVFGGGSIVDAVCKDHIAGPNTYDRTIVNAQAATLNLTVVGWSASCVLDDDDVADAFYSGTLSGVNTRIKVAPGLQVVLGPSGANNTNMPVFTTKQLSAKTVTETQTIKATVEISFGTK